MKRKILSILLALCLALTLLPVAAFATEDGGAAQAGQEQPAADPAANPEVKAEPEQPEQPEQQPEPEAKPAAEEKEAEPAPQPAQSVGEPVVLNGAGESNITEVDQTYVDTYGFTTLLGGNTYRLTGPVTIGSGYLKVLESHAGSTAILDLNGYTLTIKNPPSADLPYYNGSSGSGGVGNLPKDTSPAGIIVFSKVDFASLQYQLTLTDSSTDKTGVLDVQGANAVGIYVGRNCILNIEGGTITNSTVNETTPPTGTGVKAVLGKVNMNGGSIKNQATGVKLSGGTFNMTSGTIENCTGATGGGVLAEAGYTNIKTTKASTITMTGGTIRNCNATFGGGVYVANKGTFNMSGGSIENCKASSEDGRASGGGIYNAGRTTLSGTAKIRNCQAANAGGGIYDYSILNISDNVEITGCTAPLWSAMLVSGTISGGTFNGTVTSGGTITGGTFNGEVRNVGTITGGTFNGQVTNPGRITGGTFKGGITGTPALATGSGTEDDPYQISTAIGLEWFRDKVNDATSMEETKICAVLTADIVLDSNEAWTPIGYASEYDETKAYSGTFDGQGHTISGLHVAVSVSGLFGYTKDATIKNLTVAGSVGGGNCSTAGGGIVSYAVGGAIENCGNLCAVIAHGSNPGGGIVGFASGLTVTGCYNAGRVFKPDGSSGGGIVGKGENVKIYDCYNVGKVEGYRGQRGGIVGAVSGSVFVYNCYNAGDVIEAENSEDDNKTVCGIVGGGFGDASVEITIQNCYYLEGTRADARATAQTAEEFSNGTVLKLLKAGTHNGTNPWDSVSKEGDGKVLPGFTWQNNNHTHTWGKWTSNGDGTHSRACACGVTETAKCSGGTATRTAKAVCQVCGQPYGQLASGGGIRRQPSGGSGAANTSNTSNTTKTVKSGNTGDMGVALYAGMALLSMTGGAWVVGKKRK